MMNFAKSQTRINVTNAVDMVQERLVMLIDKENVAR
jgi:hypothetical protein